MEIAVQIALNAVIAGAIYTVLALGFNLIYSTAKFFDLGYGALTAVGGYAVYWLYKQVGLPLVPSIVLGVAIAAALGYIIEKLIYRPLRKRKASSTVLLVASLGVLTVIQAAIAIIFTSQFQTLSRDIAGQHIFTLFGGVMTETQVLILLAGLAIMVVLGLVLKYTLWGKAVRAVSDDEEVAQIVGINSERTIGLVFLIGGAIAAVAGLSVGFDTGIQPTMGLSLLLKAIVAAIIGGIGNVWGAVIGAFVLAIIENLGAWQFSGEWKDAIAFLVLIIFLLFRPQGIWPK
jgi:branched-chain amino acid transport system permease protein